MLTLILTKEPRKIIRKAVINFSDYFFINRDDIIESLGYDSEKINEFAGFIINREIETRLLDNFKNGYNIVYSNHAITPSLISNLRDTFKKGGYQVKIVIVDIYNEFGDFKSLVDEIKISI